ncbi:1783_t:CDS:1, partial [Paraglomus occultum]
NELENINYSDRVGMSYEKDTAKREAITKHIITHKDDRNV